MKKVLLAISFITLLGAGCNAQNKIGESNTNPSELMLSGKIQAVNNELGSDGNLTVSINGVAILLAGGGLTPNPNEAAGGRILGVTTYNDITVGKNAEALCSKANDTSGKTCTIVGSPKYYFKITN
jgi:hypothetical protein